MAYNFRVGEEKEIGVEITSKDSTPFSLLGTWEFKGQAGNCNIDGNRVFFLCKPTSAGNNQKATLTVQVISTDPTRLKEILKPQLTVNVSP